uniref:Prolyl 4-hydroxylase, alpha subunit n=1 Tax=Solibacter usitatus (strain Ellin6076) TaxID=234267 RepID=Q01SP9_SOLUE
MSNDIQVVDDFLPPKDYESLARLVSNVPMEYGSLSNVNTDPHGHWSRKFVRAGRHNLADVSWVLQGNAALAPLNIAWEFLRDRRLPGDSVLIRCYLNGYTYGVDGYFHRDSSRGDELTAILYVNDHWEPDWGGETAFLDEQGDIVKSVLPRRNRVVIFPANMLHAGRGVSRKCTVLRRTMIYKTRKKRSANFEKLSLFLRKMGATNCGHKEGTLHDHLVRTFAILEKRGYTDEVCFGGGLHSIYGTNIFQQSILTPESRSLISNEFGNGAEELAFLFSTLERPLTLEAPLKLLLDEAVVARRDKQTLNLRREIFNDLRKIECANLEDQNSLGNYKTLKTLWHEDLWTA